MRQVLDARIAYYKAGKSQQESQQSKESKDTSVYSKEYCCSKLVRLPQEVDIFTV